MKLKTVHKIDLNTSGDDRGFLTSIECLTDIPMDVKRIFYMHHIKDDRGGHAHIDTDQIIIAVSGSFKLKVFDGKNEDTYFLDDCTKGILTPRLTYCDLFDFSTDAVCLVLANTNYDMKKSLRNKIDYMDFISKQ